MFKYILSMAILLSVSNGFAIETIRVVNNALDCNYGLSRTSLTVYLENESFYFDLSLV